jgi:hypothetical protein
MMDTLLNTSNLGSPHFDAMVSERLNYVYIYIYKSAHTTIKRKLWFIENVYGYNIPMPEHYFGVHYPKRKKIAYEQPWIISKEDNQHLLLNSLVGNYLKFTVVRNPYSRLLSAYLDKIKRFEDLETDKKEQRRQHFNLKEYHDSFASFVEQVCREQDHEVNPHWQSQTYITGFDFVHYDKVGHVENLEVFYDFLKTQFPKIKDRTLDCSENVLHETSAASKLGEFYTAELQQKVYQRYKNDFINFGYSESLETIMPLEAGKISGSQQGLLKTYLNTSIP